MGPGDLPPTTRCTAYVPVSQARTAKRLVELLKVNNPGLRSDGLHLTREGRVDSKGGRVCIFAAEQDVFRHLQQQGMWLYLCWGRLNFRSRATDEAGPVVSQEGGAGGGDNIPSTSAPPEGDA